MEFKPAIFIGSSTEGFSVAQKIYDHLHAIAECILWKKGFELGKSNYENLVSKIAFYDYAILVATADDVSYSRDEYAWAARDNILFEFGLFAGGLGRDRVFYIVQENTKMPTDLSGITLPFIPQKNSPDFDTKLKACTDEIRAHIAGNEEIFSFGLIPSTALAYGYFINFVERTIERLLEDQKARKIFQLEDDTAFRIGQLQFTILIPNDLSDDMFKKVKAKRLKDGWQKLKVEPKDVRDYDFSVDVSRAGQGLLHLVDIPLTLNALNKVVQEYAHDSGIGKDDQERLLEQREIRNFKRTLDWLIGRSAIAKNMVSTEIVNI